MKIYGICNVYCRSLFLFRKKVGNFLQHFFTAFNNILISFSFPTLHGS